MTVITAKLIDPPVFPFVEDLNVVAGGELWLGDPDEVDPITGEHTAIKMCAYVGIGFVRGWDSFIYARTDTISLQHLVRAFAGPKVSSRPPPPLPSSSS